MVANSTPPRFVNSQLVSLPDQLGFLTNFCSICICICFIYTAPQACSFKYKPCINIVALPFFYLFLLNSLIASISNLSTGMLKEVLNIARVVFFFFAHV